MAHSKDVVDLVVIVIVRLAVPFHCSLHECSVQEPGDHQGTVFVRLQSFAFISE